MNKEIIQLAPLGIWRNFSRINAIPRPSKKEEAIVAFVVRFCENIGLEPIIDTVGNVIVRKPASFGLELRKMVTLQAHLDMVHQKNKDTIFDFDTQGIEMKIEGDWVTANGTTLGADNGIGAAAILTLLESTDIAHPPLEALFTIDEETGMTGAFGLKGGILKGEILLNLDTEEDDEVDIGCAGGVDVTAKGEYTTVPLAQDSVGYVIKIAKLNGGHSGIEINKGLGNANKIVNRIVFAGLPYALQICEVHGGGLRNAIPRESFSTIAVPNKLEKECVAAMQIVAQEIKEELYLVDAQLTITIEKCALTQNGAMETIAQQQLVKSIYAAHNGVYSMSAAVAGLVATSNNIASVSVSNGKIQINCLLRSSITSGRNDMANTLKSVFELAGYEVAFSGAYPGWNPNPNSEILKILRAVYKELFKSDPRVVACHAGLECGIIGANYPNMDMISFGPTILGAHSPEERVSITSVAKFWKFLLVVLKSTP